MAQGPVIGPFDRLVIVGATAYTLSSSGGAYVPGAESVGENRKRVSFTAATLVNVTIPQGLTRGYETKLHQAGTGVVTVKGATGVTVNGVAACAASTTARYQTLCINNVDDNAYTVTNEPVTTAS